MNVTMRNADLVRELVLLEKVIHRKPSIPVLANVLIQAEELGRARLSATDLEIGLTSTCVADITEPGTITLPVRKFLDIVRAQSDPTINLAADAIGVKFSSGQFRSRLQALAATDFPKLPSPDGQEVVNLPRVPLKNLIAQVRFAISDKDQQRYYMKAALMALTTGAMKLVATDSSRLALSAATRTGTSEENVLIPSKAIDELSALLSEDGDKDVEFCHSDQHLFFRIDDRLMISRQVEGTFPAYERIIPATDANQILVKINRQHLVTVLKRHILISDVVLLALTENALDVSSVSAEVGEGSERISVAYTGAAVDIRFRAQYVLDFLTSALGESITLSLKDSYSPALFSDADYINVIMGMRV